MGHGEEDIEPPQLMQNLILPHEPELDDECWGGEDVRLDPREEV